MAGMVGRRRDEWVCALEDALPRFSSFRPLGKGGAGAVYSVWDGVRREEVAIKLMRDGGEADLRVKFEREYGILVGARFSRLVRVYEYGWVYIRMPGSGQQALHYWYTMERCETSVAKVLSQLALEQRVEVALQVLDGLAFLHAKGIAHRDIKSDNVFLMGGSQAQAKIGDFGLAREGAGADAAISGGVAMVYGSPPYLAPERWYAGKPGEDYRPSDQYAAGVMVYELLSGGRAPLLYGSDRRSCYEAHQHGKVHALAIPEIRRRTFPSVDRVIGRMLAKRAVERYGTIGECKGELSAALSQDGVWSERG